VNFRAKNPSEVFLFLVFETLFMNESILYFFYTVFPDSRVSVTELS
jgi:hypothetical protein